MSKPLKTIAYGLHIYIKRTADFSVKTLKLINQFIDEHEEEIMEIWGKAQRGEKIQKIER